MQMSKGISRITACLQLSDTCNCRTNRKSSVNMGGVIGTSTYRDLCPGSRGSGMMLQHLSAHEVKIPPKTVIGNVQTAEIVPNMKALNHTCEVLPFKGAKGTCHGLASLPAQTPPKRCWSSWSLYLCSWNWVFWPQNATCWIRWISQDALNGILRTNKKWEKSWEYADVFAKDDLNFGWTSVEKQDHPERMGQTDQRSYRRIPPGLYDEVWKPLQEMIDVGAIWPSNSPWASVVILVRKRNGKLCFCIDLRKLNSLMVKDTYSIPTIQDTLDCLQGGRWKSRRLTRLLQPLQ